MIRYIGIALVLALAGCGTESAGLPYELRCDITDESCQRTIYDTVALVLEAEDLDRPRVRTISVEEHAAEVRSGVGLDDLTGEDDLSRGLRLIGFLPEAAESLTAARIQFQIDWIGAYYDRSEDMITVIDRDYEEIQAQALLAHEFVHAIQHRQFGLDAVFSEVDSEDSSIAARSVVEGDANYTEYSWVYDRLGYQPYEIDWRAIHQDNRDRLEGQVLDPDVPLFETASLFPYAYGFAYMDTITSIDGLPGRARIFEMPPRSAREVMISQSSIQRGYEPEFDFPDTAHPRPLDGHSYRDGDRVGAWYLYAFLRRNGVSAEDARTAARFWRGDELGIYRSDTEVAAVWRVRFLSSGAFIVDDMVSLGGETRSRTVVRYDDDLFFFAADSEEALVAWANQPLVSMTATTVLKNGRPSGAGLSSGICLRPRRLSLPKPPAPH